MRTFIRGDSVVFRIRADFDWILGYFGNGGASAFIFNIIFTFKGRLFYV
jgi:hypothetical protein